MSLQEVIGNCKTNAPKGFALLSQGPRAWLKLIDLPELDMGHICRCVLGQLYGEYTSGMEELFPQSIGNLNLLDRLGEEYGFDREEGSRVGYMDLTREWTALIEAAREEEAAKVTV